VLHIGAAPTGPGIYSIERQFATIDEGNAAMRMIIGFGAGGTEIKTLVQAYASESTGKRLLAEADVSSESSSAPGLAATLPVGSAISGIGPRLPSRPGSARCARSILMCAKGWRRPRRRSSN
jgi:hypothetical protein